MQKTVMILTVLFVLNISAFSFSQEESSQRMADKYHKIQEDMLAMPDLVTPDSIYTTSELKAIYYQNGQMIKLLEEIRELLRQNLEKQD